MEKTSTEANQRRTLRKSVTAHAFLTVDKGGTHFGCSIRDLSDSGARIRLSRNVELPAIVHLVDIPDKMAYEAAVIWRRAPHYGLAFTYSYPLTTTATPLFLRKLWYESAR